MFSHKLYTRAAASHTWSTVVIISQECVIDLNRERVGPTAGGNIGRKGEWKGDSEFRARGCARSASRAERKKEKACDVNAARAATAVGTRNIQRKLGHVPRERETKKKNTENERKKKNENYGERTPL